MTTKAKLSFLTVQTTFGLLYSMRVERADGPVTDYHLYKARPAGVQWVGPVYLAENGTAWRIGRDSSGALIAWKSVKISKRYDQQSYNMRGTADRKSDHVTAWSRRINGKVIDFSLVKWAFGGKTLRATVGGKTTLLHLFGEEV